MCGARAATALLFRFACRDSTRHVCRTVSIRQKVFFLFLFCLFLFFVQYKTKSIDRCGEDCVVSQMRASDCTRTEYILIDFRVGNASHFERMPSAGREKKNFNGNSIWMGGGAGMHHIDGKASSNKVFVAHSHTHIQSALSAVHANVCASKL